MKNKKILFAISNLTYGGIQTQAMALAKEYQKHGCSIYFFWSLKREESFVKKELLENDFKIIDGRFIKDRSWKKYSQRVHQYMPLIKATLILRFYGFDYIIPYQDELCHFFGAIHKYSGAKKTIFHVRNTVIENEPKQSWLFKKALSNELNIVTNSNHARVKFKKVYGSYYNLNIKTIYNGMSIRKVDANCNWKAFFGVNNYDFVVTSIANFFKGKDYSTIFKAWSCFIKRSSSNSILLIAGDEGIKGMMKSYQEEVHRLGIDKHVKFLGRTPFNIELLSITNCNILSTLNEGLPNCVIETLGMKKPFLGTRVNGVIEVVGKHYPIPLFEIGDYKALTNRLIKLYNNEYDLIEIETYSAKRFKKFTIDKLIQGYQEIINITEKPE